MSIYSLEEIVRDENKCAKATPKPGKCLVNLIYRNAMKLAYAFILYFLACFVAVIVWNLARLNLDEYLTGNVVGLSVVAISGSLLASRRIKYYIVLSRSIIFKSLMSLSVCRVSASAAALGLAFLYSIATSALLVDQLAYYYHIKESIRSIKLYDPDYGSVVRHLTSAGLLFPNRAEYRVAGDLMLEMIGKRFDVGSEAEHRQYAALKYYLECGQYIHKQFLQLPMKSKRSSYSLYPDEDAAFWHFLFSLESIPSYHDDYVVALLSRYLDSYKIRQGALLNNGSYQICKHVLLEVKGQSCGEVFKYKFEDLNVYQGVSLLDIKFARALAETNFNQAVDYGFQMLKFFENFDSSDWQLYPRSFAKFDIYQAAKSAYSFSSGAITNNLDFKKVVLDKITGFARFEKFRTFDAWFFRDNEIMDSVLDSARRIDLSMESLTRRYVQ